MKGLIVTADDFGVAVEVNDAVEQAHVHGILTAASLMVGGGAVSDAVARARRLPTLRVGLHIVLVEGRPVLPAADLPDLVGPDGCFRRDMAASAVNMFFRPSVRRQLAAEIKAQFEAYRATGLPLDHVNTHKHFHLHPTIAGHILRIGKAYGLKAMRVPLEPRAILMRADGGAPIKPAYVTGPWSALVRWRLGRVGVATADRVFGLQWSGAMTVQRVRGLIEHLPDGITELYVHPATAGGFDGEAPGYLYAEELAALTAPDVKAAVQASGARLGGFADLT
ncbi:MAG: hopanoid biosynthesis-associated protein HpnK [Caulobacteraceae bacterium]